MKALGRLADKPTVLSAVLAVVVLDLILIQPNHPAAVAWNALLLFPLELPFILLALVALGQSRAGLFFRIVLVFALTCIALLKSADFLMFTSLNRGFNIVADLPLVVSFHDLIVGTLGRPFAIAAIIGTLLGILCVVTLLWWACDVWSSFQCSKIITNIAAMGTVLSAAAVAVDVRAKLNHWKIPASIPGTAFTARVGVERLQTAQQTMTALRTFRAAAKTDQFANQNGLLDLIDRDVLIAFIESYGRTSFDTPFYADTHRESLTRAQTRLDALGLTMASTFLSSPTTGGQSWLAHSTFANGLWIDNQNSYAAALTSGRQTLFHLAARSGFRTAAVMPQITLEWPESKFMGFDTVLAARDLGYAGKPFNWITMPDQFTFTAMDRLLRNTNESTSPMFIQVALGSSHAPWVPVPELIAWADIADGTVFNPIVEASEPPSVLWQDKERVREQYRMAVDYALNTVFSYVALHANNPPLMFIIGDHQAASFVALDDRPQVPMHVVGPEHLVKLVADGDFDTGLIPSNDTTVRGMDQMRAHLLQSLSSNATAAEGQ